MKSVNCQIELPELIEFTICRIEVLQKRINNLNAYISEVPDDTNAMHRRNCFVLELEGAQVQYAELLQQKNNYGQVRTPAPG
jgi:hypothetical protein